MGLKDDLLLEKLKEIKNLYEEASKRGTKGTLSAIRASKLIMPIHEYIKEELIAQGINPSKIFPRLNRTKPEIKLTGFLKEKNQDITILPYSPKPEELKDGPLIGKTDKIGKELTNKSLSINVRSQLSSIAKNFDTLYERTFAEALNLHVRCPNLVMGEVYLVPLKAYDPDKRGNRKIKFKEKLPLVKYIKAFQALNDRGAHEESNEYKYERVCLLIIDFTPEIPNIINDVKDLLKEGLITEKDAGNISLKGLTINDFISDILKIYKERHGSLNP